MPQYNYKAKPKGWTPTKEEAVKLAEEVIKNENAKKRERPDAKAMPEKGDVAKSLGHTMRVFALPRCDMTDPEAVAQRLEDYFKMCVDDDVKPSAAELALAFGLARQDLAEYRDGRTGKVPEVRTLLKKAYAILDAQMNYYMENGKINPVAGIFLMKNHHGYTNEQEIVVKPTQALGEGKDQGEIEARYLDSIAGEEQKLIEGPGEV